MSKGGNNVQKGVVALLGIIVAQARTSGEKRMTVPARRKKSKDESSWWLPCLSENAVQICYVVGRLSSRNIWS